LNILVSAYLDKNIGDDLMIKVLAKKLSGHKVHLICTDRSLFVPFEGLNNIEMVTPPNSLIKRLEFYKQYDLFIKIGGSIFIFNSKVNTIKRILNLRELLLLRLLGKNIAIIGCNFGVFKVKIGKLITRIELGLASLVTVRDKASSSFLKSKKLRYYPDIVFSYDLHNMKNERLEKRIGISVYRSVSNTSLNYDYYKKMSDIADEYIKKTNGRVSLFAFDSENENDTSAAFNILRQSRYKENIDIFVYTGDEREIIESIIKCEALVATRFHSAIIAIKYNIPIVPIIYSKKMNNLLDDINYQGDRFYLNKINELSPLDMLNNLEGVQCQYSVNGAIGHINEVRSLLDKIKDKKGKQSLHRKLRAISTINDE